MARHIKHKDKDIEQLLNMDMHETIRVGEGNDVWKITRVWNGWLYLQLFNGDNAGYDSLSGARPACAFVPQYTCPYEMPHKPD